MPGDNVFKLPGRHVLCLVQGFELARVTLVDGDGRRLLDELVVPDHPVVDHNTKYSGAVWCDTPPNCAAYRRTAQHSRTGLQ